MRIVCDACAAKYSIGDERVAGKVFKVRCKKCSHIIVIRGVAPPPPDEPAEISHSSDAWHVAIDGQHVGPFDAAELDRRRATGEIDDQAYVWREGLADWQPLEHVAELRREAPRVAPAEARLLAERNESSVLFTLGNLVKLAAPTRASPSPGLAGEGSGLIDIRALANTFLAPAARPAAELAIDVAPLASTGFEPIVLAPARPPTDRRVVFALAGVSGLLVVVTAILVLVLMRDDAEARRPAALEASPLAPLAPPPAPASLPPPVATPVPAAPPPPSVASVEPARPVVAPSRPRTTSRTAAPPRALVPPQRDDECTEISCVVSGYADACCRVFQQPAAVRSPPAATSLPEALDRMAITDGIANIETEPCGAKSSATGIVKISIKVSPSGSVSAVTVKETPDPALGTCVAAAAHKATFPKSKRGSTFAAKWRF